MRGGGGGGGAVFHTLVSVLPIPVLCSSEQ